MDIERFIPVGPTREGALLSILLIHAGRLVPADRLIEDLWRGEPPPRASATLQTYIRDLRRLLDPGRSTGSRRGVLVTRRPGYQLEVGAEDLDAWRFERLADEGHRLLGGSQPGVAMKTLRSALSLWRGTAFGELSTEPFAIPEVAHLEERRLTVIEDRVEADLVLGRHGEVIGELEVLVVENPYRERMWAHLVLALYRSGRQAEALRSLGRLRQLLGHELGIEPTRSLRTLEESILLQKPELDWVPPEEPLSVSSAGIEAVRAGQPATAVSAATALPELSSGVELRVEEDATSDARERVAGETNLSWESSSPGFVGRTDELQALASVWTLMASGQRALVAVTGEPGIGKTGLAAEFAKHVNARGGLVLFGRWDALSLWPFQAFRQALGNCGRLCSEATLRADVGDRAPDLARLLPGLAERLGGDIPQPADPETDRYRLFEAVDTWLTNVSARCPVLLVLDDLHWADKPSLLLLQHLMRVTSSAAMLLVTYCPTEVKPGDNVWTALTELRRTRGFERIALGGLSEDDVLRLLANDQEHPPGGREVDLARLLQKETAGNPFFVREILRHLAESGSIIQRDGGWTPPNDVRHVGVPGTLRDVVLQRVSRLGENAAKALSAASVIGQDFDLDVLARVCPSLGEDDLIEVLDRAVEASLLIEVGGRTDRYSFVHALIQRSLYADLSVARRRRIHHRAAEALEALHGPHLGPHVGALAHHWTEAGLEDAAKARPYAQQAGEAALAQSAPDEAVRWFIRALEVTPRGDEADIGVRCELLIRLGAAQRQAGDGRYRETLLEAAAAARELGDRDRLVDAALANNRGFHSATGVVDTERVAVLRAAIAAMTGTRGPAHALLLATLAVELTYGRNWGDRLRLADEALAVARRVGDEATLARVLTLRFYTLNVPETLGERQAEATEALALADDIDDPVARGHATWFRMWACCERGDIAEADRRLEELGALTDQVGPSFLRYTAAFSRSWRALLAGRTEEAEALATEALQLGNESGEPEALVLFASQLVEIRRYQGRLGEVVDLLKGAVDDNPGIPGLRAQLAGSYCELGRHDEAAALLGSDIADGFADYPYDPLWLVAMALLAESCARLGMAEPATLLYWRLVPWRDQMPYAGSAIFGSVKYYLGLLATTMGLFDAAECHFSEAAEHHERIGAAYWLAVTRLGWARMLKQRQCPADAARIGALRDQTLAAARELGFTAVAREADALL